MESPMSTVLVLLGLIIVIIIALLSTAPGAISRVYRACIGVPPSHFSLGTFCPIPFSRERNRSVDLRVITRRCPPGTWWRRPKIKLIVYQRLAPPLCASVRPWKQLIDSASVGVGTGD